MFIVWPVSLSQGVMKGALVVLICVVTCVDSNASDFFSRIGDEISKQFKNAWIIIKEFLKRPVRAKRLNGNIINDKDITHPTITESPEDIDPPGKIANEIIKPTAKITILKRTSPFLYFDRNDERGKIILPIIVAPEWRTMKDWFEMQRPPAGGRGGIFKGRKEEEDDLSESATEDYGDVIAEQLDPEPVDENIRLLIFIY